MNRECRFRQTGQYIVKRFGGHQRAPMRISGLAKPQPIFQTRVAGGVAEWLNAAVLKTVEPSRAPGVRIPPPPPLRVVIIG